MSAAARRFAAVSVGIVTAVVLATVMIGSVTFHSRAAHAATPAHPYSDPVWYPLRGSVAYVDCVYSNPGCGSGHSDQSITLLSGTYGHYHHRPIYAAGAGILHVGAVAPGCASPGQGSLGTWVWIDHGAGRVSRYGHLASIDVPNGSFVTPSTPIGTTGDSGESRGSNCMDADHGVMYLNFQLKTGGVYGTPVALTTLRVCSGQTPIVWPAALNRRWPTWNSVPKRTRVDAHSGSICVSTAEPVTAAKPATPTLRAAGYGRLTMRWHAASSAAPVDYTDIELRLWHPTIHHWGLVVRHDLPTTTSGPFSYTFPGLDRHRKYAVKVSFHTHDGWSRPSLWGHGTTS